MDGNNLLTKLRDSYNLCKSRWQLSKLNHIYLQLPNGAEIYVLDTGAVIDAEAEAMLQALHSRSMGGIKNHLKELAKHGAANFMNVYYLGFGHKSIGDCGTTTIFIEGISMLAAKAIQDFLLYSGQESSTRYLDFSQQKMIDPTNSLEGMATLEMQRQFYVDAMRPTRNELRQKHPRKKDITAKRYEIYRKAIDARTFDITRGLLPAGASTNVTWHTNLRQVADRILFLRHHPLEEVRVIANGLEQALIQNFPNSFSDKRYEHTEQYQNLIATWYYYHDQDCPLDPAVDFSRINSKDLEESRELFDRRMPPPPSLEDKKKGKKVKAPELPKFLNHLGILDVRFKIDFGSFRDIQRHRSLVQRMPLLTRDLGFNEWYTYNLPEEVRDKLATHLEELDKRIGRLNLTPEQQQYFIPMGYNVSNRFTGDLPAIVYTIELRDSRFVHPTLQRQISNIRRQIEEKLNIPFKIDETPHVFDIKRGSQDITLKQS